MKFLSAPVAELVALADIRGALGGLLPEAVLTAGLVGVVALTTVRHRHASAAAFAVAVSALLGAFGAVVSQANAAAFFQQMLVIDAPARSGAALALLAAAVAACALHLTAGGVAGGVSGASAGHVNEHVNERVSGHVSGHVSGRATAQLLVLALALGAVLLTRTVHGMVLVLAVELLSLPSYALVLHHRTGPAARAALNYLLLGAVATGALLYGLSILYGLTGTLHFASGAFWGPLGAAPTAPMLLGLGLVLVGLLFKLGAVPAHFWAPDAYQTAPLPVALLLSTTPKIAAAVVLWRLHQGAVGALPPDGAAAVGQLFAAAAVLSLVVGTLGGLTQPNVRRLLAYSSIAQAGFLLLAIRASGGAGPVLLYAAFLAVANGAVFLSLARFEGAAQGAAPTAAQYAGLGRRYPLAAVALTIGLIGLTGLPPTVGFSAKLVAFVALWQADASWLGRVLLGVGVGATAASLFFYLRVPYWLLLKDPVAAAEPPVAADSGAARLLTALGVGLAVLLVGTFVEADWLLALLLR